MPQADILARVHIFDMDYNLTCREVRLAFDCNRYAVVDDTGAPTGEYFPLCEYNRPGPPGSGVRREVVHHVALLMHWPPRTRTVMGIEQEQDNGDGSWKAVK
jgi:hypothetical protein